MNNLSKNLLKMLLLLAIVAAVQLSYGWLQLFADLKAFAEAHANPFAFLAVMSLGCAVGLPISFCTLFAGAAFGSVAGSALSIAGIVVSSFLGYLIGKFFFPREYVERFKARFGLAERKSMFDVNFYVRAVPGPPYCVQNVVLGAMNSEIKMYMMLGVSIQGAIAVAMNILGANFSEDGAAKYVAIAALIVVIILIRIFFKRFFRL